MSIRRVAVPVETRAPGGTTNTYVLGRDPALLVDPAARTDALDDVLEDRRVDGIAVTHTHPDHVGAVADYADSFGATVYARRGYAGRFAAATGVEPDRLVVEGDRLPVDDGAVTVLDTPGHAPDHLAFARPNGSLLVGDLAVVEGSVVVGAPEGDVAAYLVALRRCWARDPPVCYPGHGPVIDSPRETFARLIAHRTERERRVREAVEAGAGHVDAVLARAYDRELTGVEDLARATVRAHLEKLVREGRIEWPPEEGGSTRSVARSEGG